MKYGVKERERKCVLKIVLNNTMVIIRVRIVLDFAFLFVYFCNLQYIAFEARNVIQSPTIVELEFNYIIFIFYFFSY